tara:strand:- start:192798 stop:193232 length:435 start_codon:yes stop_codon:yes gene_type:complete
MQDPGLELDKLKRELRNEVSAEAVDFVFHFLHMFSAYCKALEIECSTTTLVAHAPKVIVSIAGFLSDLYLSKIKLTTYQSIGKILDAMVSYELFRYQDGDSIDHFKVDRTLIEDISTCLACFSETFETNQKALIKFKYENSGRT